MCKCYLKLTISISIRNSSLLYASLRSSYMQTWNNVLDYLHSSFLCSCFYGSTLLKAVIKNSLKLNFSVGNHFHMFVHNKTWIFLILSYVDIYNVWEEISGSFFPYRLLFEHKLLCSTVKAGKGKAGMDIFYHLIWIFCWWESRKKFHTEISSRSKQLVNPLLKIS